MTQVCREAMINFDQTLQRSPNIPFGALLAFPCNHIPHLCEFEVGTLQPELKTNKLWYVSMGSGQTIADPFLALMREVFGAEVCLSTKTQYLLLHGL